MQKPLSSSPYGRNIPSTAGSAPNAQDVSHFLRRHERMASLIPSAQRVISLQKECANILPSMFRECAVVRFEAGELLMSVPHTALAARLKQQLPQLKAALLKRGWQVSAIQMKVQVKSATAEPVHCKEVFLPEAALDSLAALHQNLEDTPRNAALKAALETLVRRHRDK
jgi:hypothetical protein